MPDLFEGGNGKDIDHSAFRTELHDLIFANIFIKRELIVWLDDIRIWIDHDAHF